MTFSKNRDSDVSATENPAIGDSVAETPVTVAAPRTVKIEKIDMKGNGNSFRFFVLSASGKVLTAKVNKSHEGYSAGMEIPVSDLSELGVASQKQLARYNSSRATVIDQSLLD
jgi:hypothetical protein